ncbi:MAG TPA: VTT domain-containing protein [Thermoleophilaceae bacterium]
MPHSPHDLRGAVLAYGMLAPLVMVAAWAVFTPALFSGTLLATIGGLALGVPAGTAAGIAGATIGGVVSFAIARRCGHDAVERLSGDRLRSLQERFERRGFLAVLCARVAPGVPATLLNYACGLARIRLRDFAAASAIGGAPRVFAYTALGASGGDLTSPAALAGLGVIAALTAGAAAFALARRLRRVPAVG